MADIPEDPWNSIFTGSTIGGFLSMRQGLAASAQSALFGQVLLALIEKAGIMMNKVLANPQNMPIMIEDPGAAGAKTETTITTAKVSANMPPILLFSSLVILLSLLMPITFV
ncbi:Translocase inner membrane subunit [Corchorus capsularis]|uniref:Translocase inner membrane subunit n=1 Tax=Corchorus capsularis TaxID=210143 RepID=A0A1R3GQJ2_COCAP|nr:Translocase inner membrane subunit [Corchorus capsularis]